MRLRLSENPWFHAHGSPVLPTPSLFTGRAVPPRLLIGNRTHKKRVAVNAKLLCSVFERNRRLVSFPFDHFPNVVSLASKMKMGRVNTRRVVAQMKDARSAGDFSVGQNPRNSVGDLRTIIDGDKSVAEVAFGTVKNPTPISLRDLLPKSIGPRRGRSSDSVHSERILP